MISAKDFSTLLQYLVQKGIVSKILSGIDNKKRYIQKPEFITEPAKLDPFPLSQLLVYGYGRMDSAAKTMLTSHASLSEKVAVIGHACDVRALVELQKKQQANWDNLFLIAFEDCGFVEVKVMMKFLKDANVNDAEIVYERLTPKSLILKFKNGSIKKFPLEKGLEICENCSRCVQKSHPMADLFVSTYGLPEDSDMFVLTPKSNRAHQIIKDLGWSNKKADDAIDKAYEKDATEIITACQAKRDKDLAAWQEVKDKLPMLAKCTGCGLCVTSCPVCFCVSCNLLPQVKDKSINTLTFVTTRVSHVGDTCIECGRCGSNCPVNVPLTLIFQSLRDKFKKTRNFDAGSSMTKKPLHLDV